MTGGQKKGGGGRGEFSPVLLLPFRPQWCLPPSLRPQDGGYVGVQFRPESKVAATTTAAADGGGSGHALLHPRDRDPRRGWRQRCGLCGECQAPGGGAQSSPGSLPPLGLTSGKGIEVRFTPWATRTGAFRLLLCSNYRRLRALRENPEWAEGVGRAPGWNGWFRFSSAKTLFSLPLPPR